MTLTMDTAYSHDQSNGTTNGTAATPATGTLTAVNDSDVKLLQALALLLGEDIRKTFSDAVRAHRETHVPAFKKAHGGSAQVATTGTGTRTRAPKADKAQG